MIQSASTEQRTELGRRRRATGNGWREVDGGERREVEIRPAIDVGVVLCFGALAGVAWRLAQEEE